MFENAGEKVKIIAVVSFVVEIAAIVILGLISMEDIGLLAFLIILAVGSLSAYISSMVLYAIGETADKVTSMLMVGFNSADDIYKLEGINRQGNTYGTKANVNTAGPEYWICPTCNKQNHRTTGTCGCGTRRPN